MSDWEQLFAKAENSGVYSIAANAIPDVSKAATQTGLALFYLNLASINEKAAFLDAAAKALQFPHYFGANWDAFEDCLTDLSWLEARGYFLVVQNPGNFSHKAPREMSMVRTILRDAAAYWKQHNVRFFVGLAEGTQG
jgi:RNAse (barnase) inhibitor barstar